MKIRNGFVSNSSSSSFTIYGWSEEDLSKYISELSPAFTNVELKIYDEDTFIENLIKIWDENEWDIICVENRDGEKIFGLGISGSEIDHNLPYNVRWEDFNYPEPEDSKRKKFDEIAKRLNLPTPSLYKETFWQ